MTEQSAPPDAPQSPDAGGATPPDGTRPQRPPRRRSRRGSGGPRPDAPQFGLPADGDGGERAPRGASAEGGEPGGGGAAGDPPPGAEPGPDGERGPRGPKGLRSRFNRRRGRNGNGRDDREPRDPNAPAGAEPVADAAAAADPEAAIPVYSRQARVGVDATDARRRNGQRGAPRAKPVLDDDAPKLHKVLADAGVGSRREMEELIVSGRVSVNGQPAHVGQRIGPTDQIRINGKPVRRRVEAVKQAPKVLLYHKQPGEICSRDDPGQRATVFERLPRLKGARWVAVGRLDFNTEGLLVFTTSGEVANRLMHPRYGWEREYAVRILGRIEDDVRDKLLAGIELEDGPAAFTTLEDVGGDGANHWYRVVIAEGRNREVRRIFEAVGLIVSRLVRIRFGPIGLPRGLARGRWVELAEADALTLVGMLKQAGAGTPRPQAALADGAQPDGVPSVEAGEVGHDPRAIGQGVDRSVQRDDDEDDDLFASDRVDDNGDPLPPDTDGNVGGALPLLARDDDEDDDLDEDERQPAFLAHDDTGPKVGRGVNADDDDWQPTSADAHLSGILKVVRKNTREQRFGAGSGFGQPGLPGAAKPPGGGQGKRGRKRPAGGGQGGYGGAQQRFGANNAAAGAGAGAGAGFGGPKPAGGRGGQGANRGGQGGNRGGQGGNRGGQGQGQGGAPRGGAGGGAAGGGGGGNRSGGGGRRRGPAV
jgi:23S rRNA pseudouridine2605 synthase